MMSVEWMLSNSLDGDKGFMVGDYFTKGNNIFKIVYFSQATGVELYLSVKANGYVSAWAESLEKLIAIHSKSGVMVKVAPVDFNGDEIARIRFAPK